MELVYVKKILLLIEFWVKKFKTTVWLEIDLSYAQQHRITQFNELDEMHREGI